MPDFEKSGKLLSEVWKLPDTQLAVLFEYVSNHLYGDMGFNEAVEQGLKRMKVRRSL